MTANSNHTPGPWEIGGPYPGVSVIHMVDSGSHDEPPMYEPIAHLWDYRNGQAPAEVEANARLIAAAPDLLAVLEECADYIASAHTNYNPFVIDARAAIEKAKGQ